MHWHLRGDKPTLFLVIACCQPGWTVQAVPCGPGSTNIPLTIHSLGNKQPYRAFRVQTVPQSISLGCAAAEVQQKYGPQLTEARTCASQRPHDHSVSNNDPGKNKKI